jgi:hypothetical protein
MDIHLFATRRNHVFVAITTLLIGMLMVSTSAAAPPVQQATPTYKWTDTPIPTDTPVPTDTPIPTNTPTAAPTAASKRQPTPQPTPAPVLLPESGGMPREIIIPLLLLASIGIIFCILLKQSVKHLY